MVLRGPLCQSGSGVEQARVAREVVIPDIITVQELSNRMAVRGVDIILAGPAAVVGLPRSVRIEHGG